MMKKLMASAVVALTALLMWSAFDPAEARSRGGAHGFSGGKVHSGRAFHAGRHIGSHRIAGRHFGVHKHVRRHHRHRLLIGVPLVYGAYAYADGCYWLKQRALVTGSSYWWDRYYGCIGYY